MTLSEILVLEDLQDKLIEIEYRAILKDNKKRVNCYVGSAIYDGADLKEPSQEIPDSLESRDELVYIS